MILVVNRLIFNISVFFSLSFLQFRDMDSYAGRTTSSIRTETKYTDDMGAKILHDSYLRSENRKEAFSAQKFEQRKSVQRLSIEFFVILIFSLGICSGESLFVVYSILFIPL